jgi:hypothetical protein
MFTWLGNLPTWFQIIFSVISILGITMAIVTIGKIIYQAIKLGVKWKSDKGTLEFGAKESLTTRVEKLENASPHASCPYHADVIYLLNESNKIQHEKLVNLHVNQIRDQMNVAEQTSDRIRSYMLANYLKLLENKGLDKIVGSVSYHCYRLLLKDISVELLREIRQSFRENHFIDMNDVSFNSYISSKFEFFRSNASELINQYYFYDKDIKREELFRFNMENITKVKELFFHVYSEARMIAREYKQKEIELDEKLEKLLEKFL